MISNNNKHGKITYADSSNSYFSYLWNIAKSNGLYKLGKRLAGYFSKFRIISVTLKVLGIILTAIETSAFVFVVAVTALIILPPFILGFFALIICSSFYFKHDKKRLKGFLSNRKTVVFFTDRKYKFHKDSFFVGNAFELTKRGYRVIIVTPFILSPAEFCGCKKYFLNLTQSSEGIVIIRQQFFFHVKRHLFKSYKNKLIYVY